MAKYILLAVNEHLTQRGLLVKAYTPVNFTLIAEATSTKDEGKARIFNMHSSKKVNQWYFGMKAHIGEVADSGLVHTVLATAGHVHDINEGNSLPHGQVQVVFADADCQGIQKRPDAKPEVLWHVVMPPCKKKALDKSTAEGALFDAAEKLKAGERAKVEHPFRVINRQFGRVKANFLGLKKRTEQLMTLFALNNLWMMRSKIVGAQE